MQGENKYKTKEQLQAEFGEKYVDMLYDMGISAMKVIDKAIDFVENNKTYWTYDSNVENDIKLLLNILKGNE